jgi:hypothetical protein
MCPIINYIQVQRPKNLESSAIPIDQLILYINNLSIGSILNRNALQLKYSHGKNLFAHGLFV